MSHNVPASQTSPPKYKIPQTTAEISSGKQIGPCLSTSQKLSQYQIIKFKQGKKREEIKIKSRLSIISCLQKGLDYTHIIPKISRNSAQQASMDAVAKYNRSGDTYKAITLSSQ